MLKGPFATTTQAGWWDASAQTNDKRTGGLIPETQAFFNANDFRQELSSPHNTNTLIDVNPGTGYESALVEVFEQIALSPRSTKPPKPTESHKPPKASAARKTPAQPEDSALVNLPDIFAVNTEIAPAPVVDWPLIDDHHRNKNTNPFLEDELLGLKETVESSSGKAEVAASKQLGAFADEEPAVTPRPAFESAKQRKKQQKLAKKMEKQAKRLEKDEKKKALAVGVPESKIVESRLFKSEPVYLTHIKKGTGKIKRGRIQIDTKDDDMFPETDQPVVEALEMMHPTVVPPQQQLSPREPRVIRREYTGSSSNSDEEDVVPWWNEAKEKKGRKDDAKEKRAGYGRKRSGSVKEIDHSEVQAREERKRALSNPLSRSQPTLNRKDEKLRDKELRKREKEEAKLKEKAAKLEKQHQKKMSKLLGKEKKVLVPTNPKDNIFY